jgi:lambda repressor-like predicted transcriptional regulator
MANEQLKDALRQAGMTPEQFAEIIQVDPKTVQRWLAGRTPYPRHRHTIAQALDVPEHELWPGAVAPPTDTSSNGQTSAAGTEVTGTWGYLDDPGTPDPADVIANSDGPIDLLENGLAGISLDRAITQALSDHASAERPARIITPVPGWRLETLIGNPHIQIIVIDPDFTANHTLLRAGDTMLLSFDLAGAADWPAPLLTLTRQPEGLFERLLDHLDLLCEEPEKIITQPEELDIYRTNAGEDEQGEEEYELERPDERENTPGYADDLPFAEQLEPPRRWPGRPPEN